MSLHNTFVSVLEINFDDGEHFTFENVPGNLDEISLSFRRTEIPFEIMFIPTTVDQSFSIYNLSDFLGDDIVGLNDDQKATPGQDEGMLYFAHGLGKSFFQTNSPSHHYTFPI